MLRPLVREKLYERKTSSTDVRVLKIMSFVESLKVW